MTTNKLGMNVSSVEGELASLRSEAEMLRQAERMLHAARLMSANPLSYALNPGAAIIAPWSTFTAAQAQADLANAMEAIEYLVVRLSQEAAQQRASSDASDASYLHGAIIPVTAQRPTGDSNPLAILAGDVLSLYDIITVPFFAVREIGMIFDKAPPWMKSVAKYSTKYLLKLGNLVPGLGAVTGVASTALEWEENAAEGNHWGNVRNTIGASLAVAEVATIPAPPVAAVIATVGLAWDVFDLVWDIGEDFIW